MSNFITLVNSDLCTKDKFGKLISWLAEGRDDINATGENDMTALHFTILVSLVSLSLWYCGDLVIPFQWDQSLSAFLFHTCTWVYTCTVHVPLLPLMLIALLIKGPYRGLAEVREVQRSGGWGGGGYL